MPLLVDSGNEECVSSLKVNTLVNAEWLVIKFLYGREFIPSPNTRAGLLVPLEQLEEIFPFLMLEGFQYWLLKYIVNILWIIYAKY